MQNSTNDVTGFKSVDQAPNPAFFPQFMDTSHALPTTSAYKQRIMEQLALQDGATVLDVGCGICLFPARLQGILQSAHEAGAIAKEELTRFWDALAQAEQEQHFFAGSVGFIVSGRKPV